MNRFVTAPGLAPARRRETPAPRRANAATGPKAPSAAQLVERCVRAANDPVEAALAAVPDDGGD